MKSPSGGTPAVDLISMFRNPFHSVSVVQGSTLLCFSGFEEKVYSPNALRRIEELERQISDLRKAAKAKTSAAAAADLEVANLQARLARADDERGSLSLDLQAKVG